MKKKTDDKFIMLPIVDFCFKELMQNAKVRQGFIASLLAVKPEMVKETELLPTILPQEHADDKQGILDFIHFPEDERCYRTISFCDVETGELYSDLMEIKILELKKLQKNVPDNSGLEAMEHSDEDCAGYSGVNAPAQSILNSSVYEFWEVRIAMTGEYSRWI